MSLEYIEVVVATEHDFFAHDRIYRTLMMTKAYEYSRGFAEKGTFTGSHVNESPY